jgi:RimJ/RimL family protein N-acetyltransferase
MRMMRVREGLELIRSNHGRRWLRRTARERLYSRRVAIGVRRDLSVHVAGDPAHDHAAVPPAKIPLVVRQLRPDDDLSFIAAVPGLAPQAAEQRAGQRWLLSADLPACWVAVDPDGKVCFMAWLLTARDNAAIRAVGGKHLPELQPDEGMFEGVYTRESDRGLGIMKDACNQILERARDFGVRYGMGIILEGNVASLAVAEYGGFAPFNRREESWFLFRQRIRHLPLANATK